MKSQILHYCIALTLGSVSFPAAADTSYINDSLPQHWTITQQFFQTTPSEDNWWLEFNDPLLNNLIEKAVANNYNAASAIKRMEIASKAIKDAESAYFPSISANAGWARQQSSGATVSPIVPSSTNSAFSIGASMNWEIDVFGRVREAVKAKKAAYQASRADYDAVLVSLCANLATAYMNLRTCQKELAVANDHIFSQQHVLDITQARFEADLGNMLDVSQARSVLYSTQSTIPGLEARIATYINTICILTGDYPGTLTNLLSTPQPMPQCAPAIAVGVPSDLLRRRPDIVEAEMQLAQYAAQVGIAKKDFLPTLSLTGSIGTSSRKLDNLFGSHSLEYSVAPQLSWTIFDGLARHYRTAEAKLQLEAAVDDYNLTLQTAVKEVDDAMIEYSATLQAIELQKKVVEESERSLKLAFDLYKEGLSSFTDVMNGQISWLSNQNSLVELEGEALSSLIGIYQALGGGWNVNN